jgi:hypothetical protein
MLGKPNNSIHLLITLLVPLFVFYIALISVDNDTIVWNPADWVAETVYLINLKPTAVPASFPAPSGAEKKLVDPALYLPFYLILRDPQFNYLAQFALSAGIQIKVTSDSQICGGGDSGACYSGRYTECTLSDPGTIYIDSNFANAPIRWSPAGILVHELTHAWNRLKDPSYYCQGKYYLSDEFKAFVNQEMFKRQYERLGFLDYFNRQGVLDSYCLYYNTKQGYQNVGPIDDTNLKEPSGSSPFFCGLYSDILSF